MTVSSSALITLAEAKAFPGMASLPAADESMVEALIEAATAAIENHCRTSFVRRVYQEEHTYDEIRRHSADANTIYVRRPPIYSGVAIVDQDSNSIDSDDFWTDKAVGGVRTTGTWDVPQDTNGFQTYWTVTYTGGRYAATANVDADLKLACKMLVAMWYKRPDPEVSSKSVGDLSLTYRARDEADSGESLPIAVRNLVARFRRRFV